MSRDNKNINPDYKRPKRSNLSAIEILDQIKKGNNQALSHAISLAESVLPKDRSIVAEILKNHKQISSKRIAITGPPGAGKSTLIDSFGAQLVKGNTSIAVLTIDPSSPESGGSILGDKTRMERLANEPNAYIRPSASGNEKGGVSASTMEAILLCELAGYDYIIIETVGVGQSEFAVADLVDMYILVVQPGSGDDLQGIKRGIMELADLYVVNKADGNNLQLAEKSAKDIDIAKSLLHSKKHGIKPKTLLYSSETLTNVDALKTAIEDFFIECRKNDFFVNNRKQQLQVWLERQINKSIIESLNEMGQIQEIKTSLHNQISNSEVSPFEAEGIIKNAIKKLLQKDN